MYNATQHVTNVVQHEAQEKGTGTYEEVLHLRVEQGYSLVLNTAVAGDGHRI